MITPRAYVPGSVPGGQAARYADPYVPGNVPGGQTVRYADPYVPGNVPGGQTVRYADPYVPGNVPGGQAAHYYGPSYTPGNVPGGQAVHYADPYDSNRLGGWTHLGDAAPAFDAQQSREIFVDWVIPWGESRIPSISANVGDTIVFEWHTESIPHNVFVHPTKTCAEEGSVLIGAISPVRYVVQPLSLIHISEPTRLRRSRMPSSA